MEFIYNHEGVGDDQISKPSRCLAITSKPFCRKAVDVDAGGYDFSEHIR